MICNASAQSLAAEVVFFGGGGLEGVSETFPFFPFRCTGTEASHPLARLLPQIEGVRNGR